MWRLRWRTLGSWKRASQPERVTARSAKKKTAADGVMRGYHSGYLYFAARHFALARPLPRVPRRPPRAAPPLPAAAPRPPAPAIRDGAGVENLGVGFEDVGGFSTKDVSVVLCPLA